MVVAGPVDEHAHGATTGSPGDTDLGMMHQRFLIAENGGRGEAPKEDHMKKSGYLGFSRQPRVPNHRHRGRWWWVALVAVVAVGAVAWLTIPR